MTCVIATDPSPRVQAKRTVILRMALKVFAKDGFRQADVQVIADMAKVGKGTVYRHFGNKEQLFLATATHCLDRLGDYVGQRVTGAECPAVSLKNIAVAYAEFYQKHPQCVEIMIQQRAEFRDSTFPCWLDHCGTHGEFDRLLQQAMDQGAMRDIDIIDAANVFSDLLYGSVINGCIAAKRPNLIKRLEHAVDIFLNGLLISA